MKNLLQYVLNKCSSGLYMVSSKNNGKFNGQISDALLQVEAIPPRIILSITKTELTYEYISKSRVFAVSILKESFDPTLIELFGFHSGREVNKFENIPYILGKNGCPILKKDIIASFEAKVFTEVDVGNHMVYFADVMKGKMVEEGNVMTYCYYQKQIRGPSHEKSIHTETE